jgi:predicted nucleic acid-binding protein
MILVDTSVWIEHLRTGNDRLKALPLDDQVLCHPFVIGELACGTLQKREEILTCAEGLTRGPFAQR